MRESMMSIFSGKENPRLRMPPARPVPCSTPPKKPPRFKTWSIKWQPFFFLFVLTSRIRRIYSRKICRLRNLTIDCGSSTSNISMLLRNGRVNACWWEGKRQTKKCVLKAPIYGKNRDRLFHSHKVVINYQRFWILPNPTPFFPPIYLPFPSI